MAENPRFGKIWAHFAQIWAIFFSKIKLSLFLNHNRLAQCKKSKKLYDRFSRKTPNARTDERTDQPPKSMGPKKSIVDKKLLIIFGIRWPKNWKNGKIGDQFPITNSRKYGKTKRLWRVISRQPLGIEGQMNLPCVLNVFLYIICIIVGFKKQWWHT